jgi:hypothetical protein
MLIVQALPFDLPGDAVFEPARGKDRAIGGVPDSVMKIGKTIALTIRLI